jgi:eukaryotic-like serine/threonine-protein kinase
MSMTPDRWQQIKLVLENAMELPPKERSAYVVKACSDEALRLEVQSFLALGDEEALTGLLESSTRPIALMPGTKLGDYEVQSLLGAGGMGEVYRARDPRLRRDVAIKVLPLQLSSDLDRLRRFEQEAWAAAALNHPNILAVHQMGSYNGAPYLVSELLDGINLRGQLRSGPLPLSKAIDYCIQIAYGLAAAHDKGIVHRDLKPENLFVTKEGRVKILDFGLAKLMHTESESIASARTLDSETTPGVVMGTVGYMSPEQVRGQRTDHRADIFAFGAILYETLTGKRTFQKATSVETLNAILNEDPAGISQLIPSIPPALERLVHRCLEKNPEQRFQSASDLAFALEALSNSAGRSLSTMDSQRSKQAPSSSKAPPYRRFIWLAATALALIVGGLAITRFYKLREHSFGPAPIQTIAVLPLSNISGDESQDYFADGMTEALTTDLARMGSLQVISRSSSAQYKGTKKLLSAIAADLHADAIVEGSVQRSGDRVRITAQLISAATDKHIWAESYERDFRDVLALQDDVASAIATQVQRTLGGPQPLKLAKPAAVSPEGYEIYLKANYYFGQFDLQKAIEYYNQAIRLDPNYAPAYAHMADPYFFLGFFSAIPPQQAWGKVKELGALAVQKDDHLPEGHAALASAKLHYDWDFAGAEQEFKRAIELNPNNADIRHGYAHYLMAMGRMDESAAESRRALELDPVDDGLTDCLCWHSYAAGKYESSIQLALEVLKRQPQDTWEMTILGWDYEQNGSLDRAVAQFKKAVETEPKGSPLSTFLFAGLGEAYARAGMKSDAEQVLKSLIEKSKQSYVSPFDIALIYTALGQKDTAFEWLTKAVNERSTFLVYSKWEPRLAPLRTDPRFHQMLKKIGFHS